MFSIQSARVSQCPAKVFSETKISEPKFVLLEFWIFDVLTENWPRLDARSECTNSQQCTALICKQNVRWRNFSQKLIFTGEVKHWTSLMFAPLRLACQIMFGWSNKCLHLGNQMKIKVTLESTLNGFQSQLDCSYGTLSQFLCRLQNFSDWEIFFNFWYSSLLPENQIGQGYFVNWGSYTLMLNTFFMHICSFLALLDAAKVMFVTDALSDR